MSKRLKSVDELNGEVSSLNQLVDIENLELIYGSHIFKLKYDTLIETKLNSSELEGKSRLVDLKDCLESLVEKKGLDYSKMQKYFKGLDLSLLKLDEQNRPSVELVLNIEAPRKVYVVGSHILETQLQSGDTVDLVVELPTSYLNEKDYKNRIYFYKRNVYLLALYKHLKTTFQGTEGFSVGLESLDSLGSCPQKPSLKVKFEGSNLKVRVTVGFGLDSLLHKNKLKPNNANNNWKSKGTAKPTPYYNSLILSDGLHLPHLNYLYSVKEKCLGFSLAIKLLKLYLNLRGIGTNNHDNWRYLNDLNGFVLSMVVAYLVELKRLFRCLPFQIFKVGLEFLATHDFAKEPVVLGQQNDTVGFALTDFQTQFPILILDPTGLLNLTPNLTLEQVSYLQQVCNLSTQKLVHNDSDLFEHLFLLDGSLPYLNFDEIYAFSLPPTLTQPFYNLEEQNNYHHRVKVMEVKTERLVRRTLGNRIYHVVTFHRTDTWDPTEVHKREEVVQFGLVVDFHLSNQHVALGPKSDQVQDAQRFRQLFSQRAELRKFKDGSIREAVVVPPNPNPNHSYNQDLLQMVFQLHLHCKLQVRTEEFPNLKDPEVTSYRTQFESLFAVVQQLKLPLKVQNLFVTDARFRGTNLDCRFEKEDHVRVGLQLERFERWPNQLHPLQMAKATLLLELANQLQRTHRYTTQMVLRTYPQAKLIYPPPQLELVPIRNGKVVEGGVKFLIALYVETEMELLERVPWQGVPTDDRVLHAVEAQRLDLKEQFHYQLIHHRLVEKFSKVYPTLPHSVVTIKGWFASHNLLDNHSAVSNEVLEWIAIYLYAQNPGVPTQLQSTSSTLANLFHLLVHYNFSLNGPLLLNGASDSNRYFPSSSQRQTYWNLGNGNRSDKKLVLVEDLSLQLKGWRRLQVDSNRWSMVQKLARAGFKLMQDQPLQLGRVFHCPTTQLFDFQIELDGQLLYGNQALEPIRTKVKRQKVPTKGLSLSLQEEVGVVQLEGTQVSNWTKLRYLIAEVQQSYHPYLTFHFNPTHLQHLYIKVNPNTFHLHPNSKLPIHLGLSKEVGDVGPMKALVRLEEVQQTWVAEILRVGYPFFTKVTKL